MACVPVPILFPNMASGNATVRHRLCTLVYSLMQLNSSQDKTINRVVERVASTSTPAIEWLIIPETLLAWIAKLIPSLFET